MRVTWKFTVFVAMLLVGFAIQAWSQEPTPAEPTPAEPTPAVPEATPVVEAKPVEAKPASESSSAPKARPLTLTVDLSTGGKLTGTLVEAVPLPLKTSFGEVTIPLTEVAGIRFANKEDTVTTLVMLNGDSITGACDVSSLTVETEWGSAKINGSAIESLLFAPDLKWQSSTGLSGKRWLLVDAKTAPAETVAGPTVSGPTPASSSSSSTGPSRPTPPRTGSVLTPPRTP